MSSVDETMYRLTVAQRDAAWREVEMWQRRYDELAKMLANHAALQRPPVMLADKESYEAGRIKGREEGAAAEREALAQFFQDHWRETWTDLQIAEAIRARGQA